MGDVEFIPTHYDTEHPSDDEEKKKVGTDLYYSNVSGSDYYPDIFIGRLPGDTGNDVDIIVNKILDYEKNPDISTDLFSNVLLAAQDESGRYFIPTSEKIRTFLQGNGYTCNLVYTGGYYTGTTQDVIDYINNGCLIVNHRDHGDSRNGPNGFIDGWAHPSFTIGDISKLSNGSKLPVMFSINCRSGLFDGETDKDTGITQVDCLGEAALKAQDKGIVGFVGSTRISYSGYNDELDKGIFDAIWAGFDLNYGNQVPSPTYKLGQILNFAKFFMYVLLQVINRGPLFLDYWIDKRIISDCNKKQLQLLKELELEKYL